RSEGTSTFFSTVLEQGGVRCEKPGCIGCRNPIPTNPKTSNRGLILTTGSQDLGQHRDTGNPSL
ncbi:hypothetical protein B9Z19DRAFT_1006090, partial [Tuber borchii]